jgi:serine/threonine protein kinase
MWLRDVFFFQSFDFSSFLFFIIEPFSFCSNPVQIIGMKLQKAPPVPFPPTQGPPELIALVQECLQVDPQNRPSSGEILEKMQQFLNC